MQKQILGKKGEEEALAFIQGRGYVLVTCNYRTKFGEIDIIAYDDKTLCFIEVKTRMSHAQGHPSEAVSKWKKRHLSLSALSYLQKHDMMDTEARFDVISVIPSAHNQFRVEIIQDAFEAVVH